MWHAWGLVSLYPSCTCFKQHYFISSLIILNYPSLLHQTTTWSIITKIQDCLSDLDEWMFLNKLKLNKDKTVVLFFYSKHCPIKSLPPLRFGSDTNNPFHSARNIWQHYVYAFSRQLQSSKTSEILVHALVSPKLDCCNSLLYNVPKYVLKKLQSAQNAASRLITCFRKYDHVTPVLSDLHWPPVNERIKFKITSYDLLNPFK